MRISDWSSDVCSSDLGGEAIFQDLDFRRYRENVPSVAITANPVVNFDPPSDQPQQAIIGETQWGAVYLQDQVSMLEGGRLKLLFGGRYDIVHQAQVSDGTVLPDMNDQAFTGRVGALNEKFGRAHVGTPVTNAQMVCLIM